MQVELRHRRGTLPVHLLPDDLGVAGVREPPAPLLPAPAEAVRAALAAATAARPLAEEARGTASACIPARDVA